MPKLRPEAIFLLLILTIKGCHLSAADKTKPDSAAIVRAVHQELKYHPEARLQDLYKFFFQGEFGPGHLIANSDQALRYLEEELATSSEFDFLLWQPVGSQNQFYRLNLKLIKDGRIPLAAFGAAFIASATAPSALELENWRLTWQFILAVIEGMQLSLPDWDADRTAIEALLASGKVVGHHSDIYRRLYHPHYRLVDRLQFEQLIRTIE